MTGRQGNALVPRVGHRTTKRRVWLGTVVIRATALCMARQDQARQDQARLVAVRVSTATRNRKDTRCRFADVIIGAPQ